MRDQDKDLKEMFDLVTKEIEIFLQEFGNKKLSVKVTDEWSVKDVLAHITYWHVNYAANYKSLSEHLTPPLLEGPYYKINQDGVEEFQNFSKQQLIDKLLEAHKVLRKCILTDKIPKMQYKKEGRIMSSFDFLKAVDAHLRGHTKQIKKI